MRKLFERIVDFMEENGSIQSEYRDVYLFALQTVAVIEKKMFMCWHK